MARPIVTQSAVNAAAAALVADGAEPSIVAVQSRIGGGSFTTIKRCLDVWRQEQATATPSAPDLPAEVQARGNDLVRAVWALATRDAQRVAQQARDEAATEVAAVRGELVEASTEIARLERVEADQVVTLDERQAQLREAELALTEARTQARRVPELESTLVELRAELVAARKDATDQAVAAGKRAGEVEALRTQVLELLAALKPRAK